MQYFDMKMDCLFFAHFCLLLISLHKVLGMRERDSRSHSKYPPVFWYPAFPMFSNRTNPARIVVQMHDSLDFFCPDYISSQYQSFSGAKKLPSDYGAEEIYMVNGQDYQSCFAGPNRGRVSKKNTRLLLRCSGKNSDTRVKAKYQYTVSFRMFSPVPKGPEFNCNEEYLFLGIFPGHNHDEEAVEKALCSSNALRLQIFVSCSETPSHHLFDAISSPNVIQLDRPEVASEIDMTTTTSKMPSVVALPSSVRPVMGEELDGPADAATLISKTPRTTKSSGLYVARSDRKIMRDDSKLLRRSTLRPTTLRRVPDADEDLQLRRGGDEDLTVTTTFRPPAMSKVAAKQLKFHSSTENHGCKVRLKDMKSWIFIVVLNLSLFALHNA